MSDDSVIVSERETVEVQRPWAKLTLTKDPCFNDPEFEQANFLRMYMPWPERPVFVDIGGHEGIWATFLLCLSRNGTVHSFEPHPENFKLLETNMYRVQHYQKKYFGGEPTYHLYNHALGDKEEERGLRCWNDKVAFTGSCQLLEGDKPDYTVKVSVKTLDSLNLPQVDFIKIDVEHWESQVLAGATQTILKYKPRMLVETHNRQAVIQLTSFCETHRLPYEFCWAEVPAINWRGRYLWVDPRK